MTIKQALLRVTPWTLCQCVTGPMQRDNRQSALLLMHIHWEPLCLHCVGSQSRAWNSKTPLLKPCFAQIANLNCRLSTLPTLEQAVFSLILCQLLLRIKEWEVWRRNSDETRKQLQAEWMLLQSVWLIDWFFLFVCFFFNHNWTAVSFKMMKAEWHMANCFLHWLAVRVFHARRQHIVVANVTAREEPLVLGPNNEIKYPISLSPFQRF